VKEAKLKTERPGTRMSLEETEMLADFCGMKYSILFI
jgi:hypothetical protein